MTKTIIAIEDDPQITELISLLLESGEINMLSYPNGKEGLDGVIEKKPHLVLLDIMIPELSGWEVHRRIREHTDVKTTPVIILSVTQQSFKQHIEFIQSDIDFYMSKPFDVLRLRQLVDKILGESNWQIKGKMPPPTQEKPKVHSIAHKLMTEKDAKKRDT